MPPRLGYYYTTAEYRDNDEPHTLSVKACVAVWGVLVPVAEAALTYVV